MKKVKIMLLSLALIAVVGGALAFKALDQNTYCTTEPWGNTGAKYCTFDPPGGGTGDIITKDCADLEVDAFKPTITVGDPEVCYTTLPANRDCDEFECPLSADLASDE